MLLLALSLLSLTLGSSPDPTCATGVLNSTEGVCCSKSCGARCGGHGCGSLPGGSDACCGGMIRKSGKKCDDAGPPCVMPDSGGCTLSQGVHYDGNDVADPSKAAEASECCTACDKLESCYFFTFDSSNSTCYLKNANAPDASHMDAKSTSGYPGTSPPAPPAPTSVALRIDSLDTPTSRTWEGFLCWNIDASRNRQFFDRNLSQAPGSSPGPQLARQAAALARQPGGFSLLRFGGSGNDYLTYQVGGAVCPDPPSSYHECLTMERWGDLLDFTRASNAKMVCGLSMNTGRDLGAGDGPFPQVWNASNARALLEWTIKEGKDDVLFGVELGNEQNSEYSGEVMANNFEILYNLTIELWPDESKRPRLFGPDPHSYHDGKSVNGWLGDFLDAAGKRGLPIHGATHHEYIEVDSSSFTSPSKLDTTRDIAVAVNKTVAEHFPAARAVAGEIGPHNGGSPPCDHTSMRWSNFGNSLWYVDALATKAKAGYGAFCRQDYVGIDYGMVDCSTGEPLPDFWSGVAWAQTVGRGVLSATTKPTSNGTLRVYAHCANDGGKGGVTVVAINLGTSPSNITLDDAPGQLKSSQRSEFRLSAVDAPTRLFNGTGLLGTGIALNGKTIALTDSGDVPVLVGAQVEAGGPVQVAPQSIVFAVFADANAKACSM